MTRRILLPLERTDDDTGAVGLARVLVRRRKAEVLLLRVEEWPLAGPFGFGWAANWRAGELQALKESFEGKEGVPARILLPEAVPSSTILGQARLRAASLIVVPYRHERTLMRVVYGHAAERLLRESPIPVLAVPAAAPPETPGIRRILPISPARTSGFSQSGRRPGNHIARSEPEASMRNSVPAIASVPR